MLAQLMELPVADAPDTPEFMRHPTLRVVSMEGKGRGVIVCEPVMAGEMLEVSPVIPLAQPVSLENTALFDYPFRWRDGAHAEALALGLVSLVNHAADANADIACDFEARTMRLYAIRPLAAGEEVTIDYDCPLWFEARE